jgi:hypothetical protein
MVEIISRPAPAVPPPVTGERLTSELTGQAEIEHLHRYLLARDFCRGKRVLDAASGEGYGAALLAQVAALVVGVEIARDAVAHAAASYRMPNLLFLQCDARAMAVADESLDVVVSFETIEHFAQQDQFLSEMRRVLRPHGLLLVSTPDRDNYSPTDTPANPFRARGMTPQEFVSLLSRYFTNVDCLLQRSMIGSVMLQNPTTSVGAVPLCFEKRGNGHFERSTGLARPQYVVAVASNRTLESLPSTVYIETSLLGYLKQSPDGAEADVKRDETHDEVHAERDDVATDHDELREQLQAEQVRTATALDGSRQQLEAHRVRAANELDELLQRYEADRATSGAKLAELTQHLERQCAEGAALVHANERAEQACAVMHQQLAECQQRLTECRRQLSECQQQLADYRQQLVEYQQLVTDCRQHARIKEQEIVALHTSNSWRITAPLRAVSKALKRRPS